MQSSEPLKEQKEEKAVERANTSHDVGKTLLCLEKTSRVEHSH